MKRMICLDLILRLSLFYAFNSYSSENTIQLTTLNWPPYYGEELKDNGIVADIVSTAFSTTKYSVKVYFVPWERALWDVKSNQKDGLLGAYKTDERMQIMHYSAPIFYAEETFFQLSSKPLITYKTLKDLTPYTIGTLAGVSNSIEFDEADFLKKESSPNVDSLVRKLLAGRIDLIVQGRLVVIDHINNHYPDSLNKIFQVEPVLKKRALYVTIRKSKEDGLEVIESLNNALKNLARSGKLTNIIKKHNFL